MMALVNFFGSTMFAQLVLYGKQHLHAGTAQIGLLYSVESVGVVVLSLAAGPLRKRFSFSKVALSALMLSGVFTVAMALTSWYPLAVICWGLATGLGILFNINTGSLRQAIVPNHMLGRVMSVASVLAWSAIPVGTFLGGVAIQATGNVALIYGIIGVATILIPLAFSFTALGHADRYLPAAEDPAQDKQAEAAG
jgi:MFS family permease